MLAADGGGEAAAGKLVQAEGHAKAFERTHAAVDGCLLGGHRQGRSVPSLGA